MEGGKGKISKAKTKTNQHFFFQAIGISLLKLLLNKVTLESEVVTQCPGASWDLSGCELHSLGPSAYFVPLHLESFSIFSCEFL